MKRVDLNLSLSGQKSNCFDRGNLPGLASCLALCGFTPIPLKSQKENGEIKLKPAISWGDFSLPEDPLEAVGKAKELFSQNGVVGVALKCGTSSGLLVLDIDQPEKFESFYPLQKLIDQAPYVIETKDPGHYHIGFAYDPEFAESRSFLKEVGFELKSNGTLVNFYTLLPEAQYRLLNFEPLRPMPQELKEKLLSLLRKPKDLNQKETSTPRNLNLQEIIKIAGETYQEGQRQDWAMYVAGFLRKHGFTFEETKEALVEFLKSRGDEEIQMRIAAIEHTYQEPLENVKGLAGLLELGLNEEAVLRIKALIGGYGKDKESLLEVWTAEELCKAEFPKPKWLIPQILPEGLTLLSGKPKIGKSWLALLFCIEIAKATEKPLFYLALEDNKPRLKERLQVLGGEGLKNLHFVFKCPRIGKGGWRLLEQISTSYKPILIVIDPWAKLKPQTKPSKRGVDLYSFDYESIAYFKALTEQGINILIVHHKRKTEADDPLEEVLGTTGITGAVDNVLSLKRQRGAKTGTLEVIARDFEEKRWGLSFEAGRWVIVGDAKEALIAEEQEKILEAIKELGGGATPKQVADWLDKNYHTVKNQMLKMATKGLLRKGTKGTYLLENTKESSLSSPSSLSSLSSPSSLSGSGSQSSPTPTPFGTIETIRSSLDSSLSEALKNLDSGAKDYSDYSDYSFIHSSSSTPTPLDLNPDSKSDLDSAFVSGDDTPNPESNLETEEICFLITSKPCPVCQGQVWKIEKEVFYTQSSGFGECLKCKGKIWLEDFSDGIPIHKKDLSVLLPLLLYKKILLEVEGKIKLFGKAEAQIRRGL